MIIRLSRTMSGNIYCNHELNVILIIAAVVSAFLGEAIDAIAIGIIVILNAVLGVTQEYRAEKAMRH
jgi:P-type Ca2+ transporter type 2C